MIQRVQQLHDSGCFVACIAMLLNTTYEEAFSRLFPYRMMPPACTTECINSPIVCCEQVSLETNLALSIMPQFGLEIKLSNLKSVQSLKKRTSLVILRWRTCPERSHALLFDGEQGIFVDPCYKVPLNHRIMNINLEDIYYVKRPSQSKTELCQNTINKLADDAIALSC